MTTNTVLTGHSARRCRLPAETKPSTDHACLGFPRDLPLGPEWFSFPVFPSVQGRTLECCTGVLGGWFGHQELKENREDMHPMMSVWRTDSCTKDRGKEERMTESNGRMEKKGEGGKKREREQERNSRTWRNSFWFTHIVVFYKPKGVFSEA